MAEEIDQGKSSPLGATPSLEGTNFSVYSKHATGVELLLFDDVDARAPRVIRINALPTEHITIGMCSFRA